MVILGHLMLSFSANCEYLEGALHGIAFGSRTRNYSYWKPKMKNKNNEAWSIIAIFPTKIKRNLIECDAIIMASKITFA